MDTEGTGVVKTDINMTGKTEQVLVVEESEVEQSMHALKRLKLDDIKIERVTSVKVEPLKVIAEIISN